MPAEIWFSPWVLGLFGLCIGSFLNVVAYRLPKQLERRWMADAAHQLADEEQLRALDAPEGELATQLAPLAGRWAQQLQELPVFNLVEPRSACPACGHQLAWHENLPLLGWLRLGGRCSACKTRISPRYPIVELLTGLLFAAIAWKLGPQPQTLLWCGFATLLLAASLVDWDTTLLPDDMTLPLLWAGLLASALGWTLPLQSAVWGAAAGYLSLWSVYWGFKLLTGKEGMGYGDFKLLAALGAWLGASMLLPIVLLASALGALAGLAMKASGGLREGRFVPFGPFLAGAGLAVFFAGSPRVMGWMGVGLRIGLTGGIGSGKSTAAAMLVEAGALLVDTDLIARQLSAGAALPAIRAAFGEAVVVDGQLDRAALREQVFANAEARRRLEALLHPLIQAEAQRQAEGADLVVFDVPLLVESRHWRQQVDRVLVIDCDEAVQRGRVLARPGWTAAQLDGVLNAQATRAQRRAAADAVIDNSALDLSALRLQLQQLLQHWRMEESRA